ncbi:hypothetical protein [Streptomyces sp. SGAir0957]
MSAFFLDDPRNAARAVMHASVEVARKAQEGYAGHLDPCELFLRRSSEAAHTHVL